MKQRFSDLVLKLKAIITIIRLIRDPDKTESLLKFTGKARDTEAMRICVESSHRDPAVSALIKSRYLGNYNLEQLKACRPGSLGREFYEFITQNGLTLNFFEGAIPQALDDASYLQARGRQTHDIWHVVLGYHMDHNGEIALQAFMLAQFDSPLPALLFGIGFLHTLFFNPRNMRYLVQSMVEGWNTGLRAKPFLAEKWEEQWNESVSDLRKRLNVPDSRVPATFTGQSQTRTQLTG